MKRGSLNMTKQHCFIDYLSFTWVPELIVPYRKLARLHNQSFKQFVSEYHEQGQPLNLGEMEYNMVDSLKNFFMRATDIFSDCALSRSEFEDLFCLRLRIGGIFGYTKCWDILIDNTVIGLCATGGTAGSCYISFTGKGCALVNMQKLQGMLRVLPEVKITRVDVALDDYKGLTGYAQSVEAYQDQQFLLRGKNPDCDIHASGGKLNDKKIEFFGGRTFVVGSRQSGKLYRGYEKGRQQGQTDSKWFRHEIELRSANREIPLHILTEPDRFFIGFYPYMETVYMRITGDLIASEVAKCRKKKRFSTVAKIVFQDCIDNARLVSGGLVNVMRDIGMSDTQIIEHLIRDSIPIKLRRVTLPPFKQEIQPC